MGACEKMRSRLRLWTAGIDGSAGECYNIIPPTRVLVAGIGFEPTNLPLFSLAGLAVVMDNASAEVKAVAHYITLDVDHNGLAAAIEKFLL